MPDSKAQEHLKIAKRLQFQGQTEEAIREYEAVLHFDPQNIEAIAGLRSLDAESSLALSQNNQDSPSPNNKLATNFYINQAKSANSSPLKTGSFRIIILALACGAIYGIYIATVYIMNYDNIVASQNVEVTFEKPRIRADSALVNVEVVNLNPAPVRDLNISYRIADGRSNILKESTIKLSGPVPPGDRRTFVNIDLGTINGTPSKLSPKLEAITYGPKPRLKDKYAERFIQAAAKNDKEALTDYEDLVQDTDEFAPAYVGLGRSLAAWNKFDQAIKEYRNAIKIDPASANAHYYLAIALHFKKDYAAAKKEIGIAAKLAPEDPEIISSQKQISGSN